LASQIDSPKLSGREAVTAESQQTQTTPKAHIKQKGDKQTPVHKKQR